MSCNAPLYYHSLPLCKNTRLPTSSQNLRSDREAILLCGFSLKLLAAGLI